MKPEACTARRNICMVLRQLRKHHHHHHRNAFNDGGRILIMAVPSTFLSPSYEPLATSSTHPSPTLNHSRRFGEKTLESSEDHPVPEIPHSAEIPESLTRMRRLSSWGRRGLERWLQKGRGRASATASALHQTRVEATLMKHPDWSSNYAQNLSHGMSLLTLAGSR